MCLAVIVSKSQLPHFVDTKRYVHITHAFTVAKYIFFS